MRIVLLRFADRGGWFDHTEMWVGVDYISVMLVWFWFWFWFVGVCAGIRVSLTSFTRRPCAGRHLLFFAAAKKSRQKKAAHTANS
jgi:hypothetical protein